MVINQTPTIRKRFIDTFRKDDEPVHLFRNNRRRFESILPREKDTVQKVLEDVINQKKSNLEVVNYRPFFSLLSRNKQVNKNYVDRSGDVVKHKG